MLNNSTLPSFQLMLCTLTLLIFNQAKADSPLTSTPFYQAYNEIPIIYQAEQKKILTYEFAAYLSSGAVSIDKKAALINALGWSVDGQNNYELYYAFLKNKYKKEQLNIATISVDEIFCCGYLMAMDDYFHPEPAVQMLETARRKKPNSYTITMVEGLCLAQIALDNQFLSKEEKLKQGLDTLTNWWSEIYLIGARIEAEKGLLQDLRKEAKVIVFSYLEEYRKYCNPKDLVVLPSTNYLEKLTSNIVQLKKSNGVYKLPVKINDSFTIDFIFDSGASDVVISTDIATVLIKQGKLSKSDFVGYGTYQIADGSTVKSQIVILKKLQIGNFVVTNVRASIGDFSAPLLLGQSFQQKFEQFTINNENGTLILKPRIK